MQQQLAPLLPTATHLHDEEAARVVRVVVLILANAKARRDVPVSGSKVTGQIMPTSFEQAMVVKRLIAGEGKSERRGNKLELWAPENKKVFMPVMSCPRGITGVHMAGFAGSDPHQPHSRVRDLGHDLCLLDEAQAIAAPLQLVFLQHFDGDHAAITCLFTARGTR